MEPRIKQVVYKDPNIYGLAEDNKMYRWDFGQGKWTPFWNTATPTVSTEVPKEAETGSIEL